MKREAGRMVRMQEVGMKKVLEIKYFGPAGKEVKKGVQAG